MAEEELSGRQPEMAKAAQTEPQPAEEEPQSPAGPPDEAGGLKEPDGPEDAERPGEEGGAEGRPAPARENGQPGPETDKAPWPAGQAGQENAAEYAQASAGLKEDLAQQMQRQRALEEGLAGLGLDVGGLFDLLLDSPLLRQTTALAEEALAARAQKQQEDALREIACLAPELRTPELLAAAPEYPAMQQLLQQNKGMGMLDAFKLAFFDRLTRRQAAAGRQGAINAARAQRHLAGVGGQPPETGEPTEEEIQEYRRYNPRWTVAEIRRFHREYLDETGG